MLSSLLNKRITIEQSTPSVNAAGTPIETWSDYLETWAGVYTPYRNVQYLDGEVLVYTTEFTIRYNTVTSEIDNTYRIKYDDMYYEILQLSEIGNKEGIKIITTSWKNE